MNCRSLMLLTVALFGIASLSAQSATAAIYTLADLGDLPGGGDESSGFGVNNGGQAVSRALSSSGYRAYLWDAVAGMQNLGDLPSGAAGGTGGLSTSAKVAIRFWPPSALDAPRFNATARPGATGLQKLNASPQRLR